ncbi:MAG: hypothetical protein ABI671_12730 [Burkholderiales bacterium]
MSLLTGAVLLTWLHNQSLGSILVVALFHAAIDAAFTSQASSQFGGGALPNRLPHAMRSVCVSEPPDLDEGATP